MKTKKQLQKEIDDLNGILKVVLRHSDGMDKELLQKINRDVANWKLSQDEAKIEDFETLEKAIKQESIDSESESEEKYYFEPVE